jgi:serine phosphatase RsbU (regulator of sigma subunit)
MLVVAIIRTALIIIAALAPWREEAGDATRAAMNVVTIAAGVFNVTVFAAFWLGLRLPFQRALMLAMDILFVGAWVALTWQSGPGPGVAFSPLFPFCYIVVLTGALWYRVPGAFAAALALAGLYLLAIHTWVDDPIALVDALFRDVVYLFLVAIAAGYLVDFYGRKQLQGERDHAQLRLYQLRFRAVQSDYARLLRPPLPAVAGLEISGKWTVAVNEGGGDCYGVIVLDDQRVLLYIADIAGKGPDAARHVPALKTAIESVAQTEHDPARLLTRINRTLYDALQPDGFIGICLGVLDVPGGTLVYANAGQDPPILLRRSTLQALPLRTGDRVLGVTRDYTYHTAQLALEPGDLLCLYTDGVTEARDPFGREYGEPDLEGRLRAAVALDYTAEAVAVNIQQAVRLHVTDQLRRDDMALLIVRYVPEGQSLSR